MGLLSNCESVCGRKGLSGRKDIHGGALQNRVVAQNAKLIKYKHEYIRMFRPKAQPGNSNLSFGGTAQAEDIDSIISGGYPIE